MGNIFSIQSGGSLVGCCRDSKYQHEANLDDLMFARNQLYDLMQHVINQQRPQMEQTDQVAGWLSRVDLTVTEATELLTRAREEGHRSISNYKLGKLVAGSLVRLKALMNEAEFKRLGQAEPVLFHGVARNQSPTVGTETMLDKAWSLLLRADVGILGIYGMGGVGKTTLLKLINNRFVNNPNGFDVVIWIVVSKDVKLDNIQDSIWKQIQSMEVNRLQRSYEEKAQDIFNVLRGTKFVLLLDDVWQQLDLEEIGVPLRPQRNGSKVVLTTRSLAVCKQMGSTQTMIVKPLNQDEAWQLFKEKVGNIDACVLHVAQKVAEECQGLPIALITIGRAMASRSTIEEWEHALKVLRRLVTNIRGMEDELYQGMEDHVFNRLKFSYDYLSNDTIRSCFLYCSLFPKEFKIFKDDLVHYWHFEKFCSPIEGHVILYTLIRRGLLEEEGKYVILHDIIRGMAIWIACECEKERHMFFIQADALLTQLPGNEEWEGAKKVSLRENFLKSTERISRYCDTETLFLSHNKELKIVSEGLFQFMTRLTVLDLSHTEIVMLPLDVTALQLLEYLNLSYTKLEILPIQLKSLVRLKYLNLKFSKCLKMIPVGVISNLTELRVLYMLECGPPFYEGEENNALSDGNTLMKELMCLKNLCELSLTVRSASFFHSICSNQILLNSMQALHLSFLFGTKSLNISSLVHARQLNFLEISLTCDLEELVIEPRHAPGCSLRNNLLVFSGLREVKILDNMYLRHMRWLVFAPHLTVLTAKRNEKMEDIITREKLSELQVSDAHLTPFAKLQQLELDDLPKLKTICLKSLPFPCVTQISVRECRALRKLPLNSESAGGGNVVIKAEESWWSELTWEDPETQAAFSSCYRNIYDSS